MVEKVLFPLLRWGIAKEEVSEEIKGLIDRNMLLDLHKTARAHDLGHLVGDALLKLGIEDEEAKDAFQKQKIFAIYRSQNIDLHLENIKSILEKAEIDYVFLKGAFIRKIYPEQWMRTSGDIDVLVREEDLGKAIDALKNNGWETDGKKNYHDVHLKFKGRTDLELHFSIKENIENLDRVLEKVWEFTIKKDGHEFILSDEFLLFYLISHIAYHFIRGGCGVRTVLDVWLLRGKLKIDEKAFENLLKEAQIEVFADRIIELSNVWFDGKSHTDITKRMEEFILFGGAYGNHENRVRVEQSVAGGKVKNLLHRTVMPYDKMVIRYPILKKYKFLTPVFHIARWTSAFKKENFERVSDEINAGRESSKENLSKTQELLKEIGLI